MVKVITSGPTELLVAIRKAISDGTVATWDSTPQGSITHTAASGQWKNKAWFRGVVGDDGIIFNIIRPKGSNVSSEVYAIYHGRLAEMLLAHFDASIESIEITSLAGDGDVV